MVRSDHVRIVRSILFAGALLAATGLIRAQEPASPVRYGLGRPPSDGELARLDIDVRPDGKGLPDGRGTVAEGRRLYAARCVACHGPSGVEGPNDRLVNQLKPGEFPFAIDPTAPRTIGSYWPYATTLFDYLRRAMPMTAPGSLTDDEVYSLTAYLLALNRLIDEAAIIDKTSLPRVRMPAASRFKMDDRLSEPRVR